MATDLKKYGPWALITGGSEGVGAEAARQLAADGFKLVLVARKPEPLEALKAELEAKGAEVRIKSVDLSAPDALDQVRSVTDDIEIGLMFYNAGANSMRGDFVELDRAITYQVVAVNVIVRVSTSMKGGADPRLLLAMNRPPSATGIGLIGSTRFGKATLRTSFVTVLTRINFWLSAPKTIPLRSINGAEPGANKLSSVPDFQTKLASRS